MILTRIQRHQEEEKPLEGNTYDSVPPLTPNLDHLYANTQVDIWCFSVWVSKIKGVYFCLEMIKSRDRLELIADDGGGGAKMQRREKKSRLVQNYFEKGKGAGELSYDQGDADSYSQKKDL